MKSFIWMSQKDFKVAGQEGKVCKLNRSIYGLKQASRSWNLRFDEIIKTYGFEQNIDELCVYQLKANQIVGFLVLYVDDILLIINNVKKLLDIKNWIETKF